MTQNLTTTQRQLLDKINQSPAAQGAFAGMIFNTIMQTRKDPKVPLRDSEIDELIALALRVRERVQKL